MTDLVIKTSTSYEIVANYLTVPVNVGARFDIGQGFAFSIEAGPTLSYALTAKQITKYTLNGLSQKEEEDLLEQGNGYNRFEAGLNLSVAAEYRHVYFRVGTEYGLTNLIKDQSLGDSGSARNRGFHVMLGYRF